MLHDLSKSNTILNHFIAELRDVNIQKDSMRFRRNLERIGEVAALELSRTLQYQPAEVETPLGVANTSLLREQPVLATILRAGLPMHAGLQNFFDRAQNAFISAFRKHHKDGSFDVQVEYLACPPLAGKTLILSDPMLATGSSLVLTYKALQKRGQPAQIHVVCAIASLEGVDHVRKHLPEGTHIWCGAIDDELTAQAYIVPGLGDAGDLAFGEKV
ncbi:MAG: uracil phosphoribosyltransferase [Bacteroidia bacterium]|nr:uracil phosphoribosyltransferase [Bacteroidia bacterium]